MQFNPKDTMSEDGEFEGVIDGTVTIEDIVDSVEKTRILFGNRMTEIGEDCYVLAEQVARILNDWANRMVAYSRGGGVDK